MRVFGFPEYANLKVTNNPRQGFSVIVDLPVDLHLVLLVWLVFEVVGEGGIRSKLWSNEDLSLIQNSIVETGISGSCGGRRYQVQTMIQ